MNPYLDIVEHGGGLLGARQTAGLLGNQVKDSFQSLHPMDQAALLSSPLPVVGDAMGLLADARMFMQEPESRTPVNFGLSGLGLLPFMPNMGMVKSLNGVRGLKGDKLLDAQDLLDEISGVGAQVDDSGYVTLYHRTTPQNADAIDNTKTFKLKEDRIFFSTAQSGQADGYGDAVIEVNLPIEDLSLDDLFPNEASLTYGENIQIGRPVYVKSAKRIK